MSYNEGNLRPYHPIIITKNKSNINHTNYKRI